MLVGWCWFSKPLPQSYFREYDQETTAGNRDSGSLSEDLSEISASVTRAEDVVLKTWPAPIPRAQ